MRVSLITTIIIVICNELLFIRWMHKKCIDQLIILQFKICLFCLTYINKIYIIMYKNELLVYYETEIINAAFYSILFDF